MATHAVKHDTRPVFRHPLTEQQKKALAVIQEANAAGRSPSYVELMHALKLKSRTTVRAHVIALEQKGYLRPRRFGSPRDIYAVDLAA